MSDGNIVIHKSKIVALGLSVHLRIQLNEALSDWGISVSDQVDKGLLGDVLTIELTNKGGCASLLILPVSNLVIWAVISIIIRETFIKSLSQSLGTIIWIMEWWCRLLLWDSLDHHANSDVVVI